MALVKCRECGQQVSDRALKCPHCGAPAAVPKPAILAGAVGGLLAAGLGVALLLTRASDTGAADMPAIGGAVLGIGAVVVGLAIVLLIVRLRGGSS